jgi:DNA-binding transcriptional MerR regulator
MNTYTVGELATMAGITVRALHHYDEIGLLPPTGRTHAGYRLYDDSDVDRLRTILAYRELGLGLDEVAAAMEDRSNVRPTLQEALNRVIRQISRLQSIATSLERALDEPLNGGTMTSEEKLSVFGDFDPDDHLDEAQERWGDTTEYAESARRTDGYTATDWEAIHAELDDIHNRLLALRDAGIQASSVEATILVDEHREHLSRWYYDVTPEIHTGLGQMYIADPRFTETIDKAGNGLAAYLSEAIAARYS